MSFCPSGSVSCLYCPTRRAWPDGFLGPAAAAEPWSCPAPATVSSGRAGFATWGGAPTLRAPVLSPRVRPAPLEDASGGRELTLWASGGHAHLASPLHPPQSRLRPAGKQPWSPGQRSWWGATCFRSGPRIGQAPWGGEAGGGPCRRRRRVGGLADLTCLPAWFPSPGEQSAGLWPGPVAVRSARASSPGFVTLGQV